MKASEVTVEWLRAVEFHPAPVNQATIEGVRHRRLNPVVDGRVSIPRKRGGFLYEVWVLPASVM